MSFQRLTEFLDHIGDWGGIPGCDCVVYHHHKPVYRHTAGFDDLEAGTRLRSDAFYYLFSATKVITCATALTLLDDGYFTLYTPVSEFIPEFADAKVLKPVEPGRYEPQKAENELTMRDLFTMRSGLDYNLRSPGILEVLEKTDGRAPTLDIVRALAKQPLAFEPGTHFRYSLSHDVLGGVVEAITGKKLGAYMRERIFDPLGMEHTGFVIDEYMKERMAKQYYYRGTDNTTHPQETSCPYQLGSEYESGGAGLVSCVDEYILFAEALCNGGKGLNGERILSKQAIDMMRIDTIPDEQKRHEYGRPGYGYGLGVRTHVNPSLSGSLTSVGEFGWDGAAGFHVSIDPKREISIVYAQHVLGGKFTYYHRLINNIVHASLQD